MAVHPAAVETFNTEKKMSVHSSSGEHWCSLIVVKICRDQIFNSSHKATFIKLCCQLVERAGFSLSHLQRVPVRFSSIKTSALGSAPLINVSDGLAAGELFSHLSVATINTYFMTNYIHNLTRIDGAGDRSACGAFQRFLLFFFQRENIRRRANSGGVFVLMCFLLKKRDTLMSVQVCSGAKEASGKRRGLVT